jgi:hypothetical protein
MVDDQHPLQLSLPAERAEFRPALFDSALFDSAFFDSARRALRREDPAEAVALLAACGHHSRLTYAREWATHRSTLSDPVLQSVLAWLCADEAERAQRAFGAGDYLAAAEFWHHALRLDRRFTVAALGRARALLEACRSEHRPRSGPALAASWAASVGQLATAEQLAGRARDEASPTGEAAGSLPAEIRAERGRAIKLAEFWRCYARLESFGDQCRRVRNPTWPDLSTVRASFTPIAGDADRLLRRYGPGDPDIGPLLGDLSGLVETARAQLG